MTGIDAAHVSINDTAQLVLKLIAAAILFSIALGIRPEDLRRVVRHPRGVIVVLIAQFIAVPLFTIGLIHLFDVRASIALGMLLVACCPSGKISNILTLRAHGDVPLSASMSLASNLVALAAFPLLFPLWARTDADANRLLNGIHFSSGDFSQDIGLIVALPLVLGVLTALKWPALAEKVRRPLGSIAFAALLALVIASIAANWSVFREYTGTVLPFVLIQDTLSFVVGYAIARGVRLGERATRAITIEVGVRNTGLGLVLALAFFPHLGGMALVLACWSIWDVFAGIAVAGWWGRRPLPTN